MILDFKSLLSKRCLWYCKDGYYYEAVVEKISPSGKYIKVGTHSSDWYLIDTFEDTEAKFIEKLD